MITGSLSFFLIGSSYVTFLDALLTLKDRIFLKVREVSDFRREVFEAFGLIGPRDFLETSVHGVSCVTPQMNEGPISDVWWVLPCSREQCFIRFLGLRSLVLLPR
jgi:hypothetical protein